MRTDGCVSGVGADAGVASDRPAAAMAPTRPIVAATLAPPTKMRDASAGRDFLRGESFSVILVTAVFYFVVFRVFVIVAVLAAR